jgi:membrane protein
MNLVNVVKNGVSWTELRNLMRFALQRLREVRLPQVAGSLTFTTVLALVPILTIGLAILTAFPLFASFRSSLEAYFAQSLMPKGISNTILGYLTQFATKATRLSAVGGVLLMVTAIMTMSMIEKTFNQIWKVKQKRPWAKRMIVYWTIVTLGPLLIGFSMSFTSSLFTATNAVMRSTPLVGDILYASTSIFLTALAYTFLYMSVPNKKIDWRDAVSGALVAAVAFEIAKRLFAIFIKQFPTYTVIYGALAAVPIFLIWIYMSWFITLMGAVIAASLPIVKFERWWHAPTPGSAFEDAMAVLKILILARLKNENAQVAVLDIRQQTRFGIDEIEGLLERMLAVGWVARIDQDDIPIKRHKWWRAKDEHSEEWILLMNPASLAVSDVYRLFVFDTLDEGLSHNSLANKVHSVIEIGLSESLHDYFLEHEHAS